MRTIVAHGWRGYPEKGWFPWLKEELEIRGFDVSIPQFPLSEKTPYVWIRILENVIGTPDKETFLVGHSIGCQTIVRYLEKLSRNEKIGGAVFVAGFFKPIKNHSDMQEINSKWVMKPLDFNKVREHCQNSVAIFSDDDPYVSLENQAVFKEQLGSEIIIEHKKKHLSGETETTNIPSVLKAILKLCEWNP